MPNVVHGQRGTGDFSPNQRPTNFGRVRGRVSRADIELLKPNVKTSARVKARRRKK